MRKHRRYESMAGRGTFLITVLCGLAGLAVIVFPGAEPGGQGAPAQRWSG